MSWGPSGVSFREPGEPDECLACGVEQPDRRARAPEDRHGAGRDPLGDVHEALGLREVAREREERFRALRLAALGLVQPRVLERDGDVPGHHLEQAEIVAVELVQAELRDHDDARHALAELDRDGEERLLDLGGAGDLLAGLVTRRVPDEERLSRLRDPPGDPAADLDRQQLDGVLRQVPVEVAPERDGHEVVLVADEQAAVVVIDQEPELVRDGEPDLGDVVEARQLPREALEHLHVRDRAHVVAADSLLGGPLPPALVEGDDEALAARLGGHHRDLGARDELARIRGVVRSDCDSDRSREATDGLGLQLRELVADPLGEDRRAAHVAGGEDHGELLAADAADDVSLSHRRAEHIGDLVQEVVSDPVAVDVVHLLEVVEVEHHDRDAAVGGRGTEQLLAQAVVERAVVVEIRQRVGLGLVLESRADVGVVDGERRGVAEPLGEEELLVGEDRVLSDAVDVERALELAARDQRDGDQRLGVGGRPGDEADARVEVRLVREHGLPVRDGPAGDALVEGETLAHHLGVPLAARERWRQEARALVRLVDVDVLVRDQLSEGVRDALEQGVEALLREDVVEDLRQPPVRLRGAGRDQADVWPRVRLDGSRVGHAACSLIGRRPSPLDTSAKMRPRWRRATPAVRCSRA